MTKDKTVTMSRELAENIANYMEGSASGTVRIWHNQVRAMLDTPEREGFYQVVEDSDLKEIESFLGNGDLPAQSFFMRPDAARLANISMHLVREVQALRSKLAAPIVEADGMGEAVAFWADEFDNTITAAHKARNEKLGGSPAMVVARFTKPLYASQPAPVSVVLPQRAADHDAEKHPAYLHGWNACIDKVKDLNQ